MSSTFGTNDNVIVSHGTELRLDLAVVGLQNAIPAGVTQLSVGQVTYQVADLLAKAAELNKPFKDSRAARAIIRAGSQNRVKDETAAKSFLADLKATLVVLLGRESQDLTKFGFKPQQKSHPLTSAQKVVRAEKAKLTRQKRGTMGSRQKANLRQTETPSVTITPSGDVVITPAVHGSGATTA